MKKNIKNTLEMKWKELSDYLNYRIWDIIYKREWKFIIWTDRNWKLKIIPYPIKLY